MKVEILLKFVLFALVLHSLPVLVELSNGKNMLFSLIIIVPNTLQKIKQNLRLLFISEFS